MDVQSVIEQIQQVISEPTSNLPAASLLLAAVTLVVLIIVLGITFFVVGAGRSRVTSASRAPAEAGSDEKADERRTTSGLAPNALAGLLILAAVVVTYGATSADAYCADTCHSEHAAVSTAENDPHAGVACIRCHEDALPLGGVPNLVTRTRFVVAEVLPSATREPRAIPSQRCLACHDGILDSIVSNPQTGVLMSHEHPVEAGMSCSDCHRAVGHGGARTARGMTTCLYCHDGVGAPSECDVCHEVDTSLAAVDADRLFGTVHIDTRDCSGCHAQDACDDCHGVRMPHDGDFLNRGHARFAGFEKKTVCYRCHAESDCWRCHQPFDTTGHVGDWRTEHQKFPFSSPCGCHQPLGVTRSFCEDCHDAP